ncbi:hypothetical protein A2Z33_03640 [Candidatus Gottesmanbacteria bacterium RBG_16_52_11]|uniref:Uncharacterized protein n=1 Tax=Candidatus Gottesmanbacteria bacterium RBG_16_52_11 TaxID=1798374 RepID=A0A1F5YVS0_9BACT|nr:MAG: hypothetical protein A2Z33_03640 [Candidatus Gottesmanbacteria bacterium RBG_16_52_11]
MAPAPDKTGGEPGELPDIVAESLEQQENISVAVPEEQPEGIPEVAQAIPEEVADGLQAEADTETVSSPEAELTDAAVAETAEAVLEIEQDQPARAAVEAVESKVPAKEQVTVQDEATAENTAAPPVIHTVVQVVTPPATFVVKPPTKKRIFPLLGVLLVIGAVLAYFMTDLPWLYCLFLGYGGLALTAPWWIDSYAWSFAGTDKRHAEGQLLVWSGVIICSATLIYWLQFDAAHPDIIGLSVDFIVEFGIALFLMLVGAVILEKTS